MSGEIFQVFCDHQSIDARRHVVCLAHVASESRYFDCPYDDDLRLGNKRCSCHKYTTRQLERLGYIEHSGIMMDGNALAKKIKASIKQEIGNLGFRPRLAVILVGEDPASKIYVERKQQDCEECGIESVTRYLPDPENYSEAYLMNTISEFSRDDSITGILVQLPLPAHMSEERIINRLHPDKDVDCFHPINVGKMMIGHGQFHPCTPAGVMELLKEYEIEIAGKQCVVIGRSNIVGKPMSTLLMQANGTVTTCHSKTQNLEEITRQADILVSAVGKPNFVKADMVKDDAVVIDVAMNRNENGKLCGDVDFENVKKKASFITPVPGGVGPMTRAMLMKNILLAAKKQKDLRERMFGIHG